MTDLTMEAHDLAALGWAVFPLLPRDKKPFPYTSGLDDASDDPFVVTGWWQGKDPLPLKAEGRPVFANARANIGVATGAVSGMFVLDIDGDVGIASLHRMARAYAPLPQTVRQSTGKGGHLVFAWPGDCAPRNKAGSLGREPGKDPPYPGLDVRGDGGYIVAAPSIHPSGRSYGWIEGCSPFEREPAQAPRWLLRLICPPEVEVAAVPQGRVMIRGGGGGDAYGKAALQGACDAISGARPGTQNDTLHRRAFSIGRLVAGGVLERSVAGDALIQAGLRMGAGNPRDPWTRQSVAKAVEHAFGRAEGFPKVPEART